MQREGIAQQQGGPPESPAGRPSRFAQRLRRQAHLLSAAAAGHRYAVVAIDAIGVALLTLSLAGSVYFAIRLARQLTTVGLRWSAGRPGRRLLFALVGLACLTALAAFWNAQGQFRGW